MEWEFITQPSLKEVVFKIHGKFNPFQSNFPLLYPLKTSETFWFSEVFRGCKNETLV